MAKYIKLKRFHDPKDSFESRYRTCMFSPRGLYPRGTFSTPNGLFHADEDLVFAVTHGTRWAANEDLPYSEVDWLEPEVVRLLGGLIMTELFTERRCWFYPVFHSGHTLNEHFVDLTDSRTAVGVKAALLRTVNNRLWRKHQRDFMSEFVGKKYHLFDAQELSIESLGVYAAAINRDNHVLMRGIQALIKADMLSTYGEFREEATIATFIALDASHELVLRHLRANGIKNPTSHQANAWLHETFDKARGLEANGLKYFEEFYNQRIQTIHPGSRFGDSPFAPVAADDYIHIRQALPSVFAYLVRGDHDPSYWVQIEEMKAGRG